MTTTEAEAVAEERNEPQAELEPVKEDIGPVRGAWALAPGVVPYVNGEPLSAEKARALFEFIRGEKLAFDWERRIERECDESARAEMQRNQAREREGMLELCRAWFALVLTIFGEIPGVELRTAAGRLIDVESLDFSGVLRAVRGPNPVGWQGAVPRLREVPVGKSVVVEGGPLELVPDEVA